MATSVQVAMASLIPPSTSSPIGGGRRRGRSSAGAGAVRCSATTSKSSSKLPLPPINPKEPFLSKLASVAAASPESLLDRPVSSDTPPYLDLFESPTLMATPAQVSERGSEGARLGARSLVRFLCPSSRIARSIGIARGSENCCLFLN